MALANKGSLTSVTNLVQLCVLLTYIVFLGSLLPGPLEKACSVLLHDNKSSDSSPGLRKKQQPHSSSALTNSGLGHTAFVGVIVICLFLAGACSAFCSLGLVAMAYLLLLMLTGLTGCAWLAIVVLWGMRCT